MNKKKNPYFKQQVYKTSRQLRREQERLARKEAKRTAKAKPNPLVQSMDMSRLNQTLSKTTNQPTVRKPRNIMDEWKLYQQMQQYKPLPPQPTKENKTVKTLNDAFDFAATKYGGSSQYAMDLSRLLQQVKGIGYIPKPGEDNEFFSIDPDYTGNMNELFRYIHFKKLPDTDKIDKIVENIMSNDLSSPENYERKQMEIQQKRFETLTDSLGLDRSWGNKADILFDIMNSSAAWHIAAEGAYDSEQTKDNWSELYGYVKDAINSEDDDLLDMVIQMIENEESFNTIVSYVDTELYKMLGE